MSEMSEKHKAIRDQLEDTLAGCCLKDALPVITSVFLHTVYQTGIPLQDYLNSLIHTLDSLSIETPKKEMIN